jgi:amidohydrolase
MMNIDKDILELEKLVVDFRNHLHSYPELSNEEEQTSKYLIEHLERLGLEIRKSTSGHGFVALLRGREGKKTFGFRADMDALSVTEEVSKDYKSRNQGVMHACGHDGHMAMLLAFAYYSCSIKSSIKNNLLFIFQHAEEGPGGALPMIEEGLLENPSLDSVFGFHIFPEVQEGRIALREGAMMAQTGEFDIIIRGKSGHGAIPQSGIDSIVVSANIIQSFQQIISRNINPVEGSVLTVGKMYGGERRNIIAGSVTLEGTIRAFDENVYNTIKNRMVQICKGAEAAYDCKIEVVFRDMYPPVINDKKLTQMIFEILGEDGQHILPQMISEDFSYFQKIIPGVFMFLGSRNEQEGHIHPLHNCKFDFNPRVLLYGLQTYKRLLKEMDNL